MSAYVFEPVITAVPVDGGGEFAVRRIFCVGRNYAEHAREMGHDPNAEPPFFFMKPADALVVDGADTPYPPATNDLHHEIELVAAIGAAGAAIDPADALDHVWGYAAGIDLTRRDVQAADGDFVIRRNDGAWAYQLAVVVDDAEMGITDVLRGMDLLESTPRQLLLYRALGWQPPRFWHAPLMRDYRGERLAKRGGASSVAQLRHAGSDPRVVVADLLRSLGVDPGPAARPVEVLQLGLTPQLWDALSRM